MRERRFVKLSTIIMRSIHGYFPKSIIASSKNVDDTVLKESVRLKDVRFVLFSMLIISNKQHYFETSATFAGIKTTYIAAVSNLKFVTSELSS